MAALAPDAWVTNDPAVAKRFKAIDCAYDKAIARASGWSLKEKVEAHRKAKAARADAMRRVLAEVRS